MLVYNKVKNKKTDAVTILPSLIMTIGTLLAFSLTVGIGIFVLIYDLVEPGKKQLDILSWCIICLMSGVYPIALILVSSRRGLSLIKIDKNGIRRLVFGFIKSVEMQWDNIAEIRYYERGLPFIIISKTQHLEGKSYNRIVMRRDVIQIQLNKKAYEAITKYIQQPIIGLTEEKLTELKLN